MKNLRRRDPEKIRLRRQRQREAGFKREPGKGQQPGLTDHGASPRKRKYAREQARKDG